MPTITLFVNRPFPIWNVNVPAQTEIEIEEKYGKMLIARGICQEKSAHDAWVKAKLEKKGIKPEEIKHEKKTKKGGKE
jgi:hypothetical protein